MMLRPSTARQKSWAQARANNEARLKEFGWTCTDEKWSRPGSVHKYSFSTAVGLCQLRNDLPSNGRLALRKKKDV